MLPLAAVVVKNYLAAKFDQLLTCLNLDSALNWSLFYKIKNFIARPARYQYCYSRGIGAGAGAGAGTGADFGAGAEVGAGGLDRKYSI